MIPTEDIIGRTVPRGATVYRIGDVVSLVLPVCHENGIWEAHCAASPHSRGKVALDAMRKSLDDFWRDHPEAQELVAAPKRDNRGVRVMNRLLGFDLDGTYPIEWPDGQIRETCLYRMKRP